MKIDKWYEAIKEEAKRFHVSEFIESPKIEKIYKETLVHIVSSQEPRGVIAYHKKYGQGKTFIFDLVDGFVKKHFKKNIFLKTSSKELTEIYKSKGEEALLDFIKVKNIFIDDIGAEVKDGNAITKNFGNSMNVIEYVIFKRYEFWIKSGWKMHGSTNISIDQIAKIYGGRVADRITQMTSIIEFDLIATSFRQVKKIRPLTQPEKDANLLKYYPQKKEEQVQSVDMKAFLNELIDSDPENLMKHDINWWSFIRVCRIGYLRPSFVTSKVVLSSK